MANLDTSLGFKFAGTFYGGLNAPPIYKDFYFKDTETLTKGDVLNLESGEVDLAATNDTAFIGVAAETVAEQPQQNPALVSTAMPALRSFKGLADSDTSVKPRGYTKKSVQETGLSKAVARSVKKK